MKSESWTHAYFYEEITDGAFTSYIRRIASLPLLSKEEELKLAERIQEGDERALRKLVESNLRFVVKIAFRYRGCGLSLLDLINEGNIGLLEAARRYSPGFGVKFITYAVWWIRQAILQALANNVSVVHLPLRKFRTSFHSQGSPADVSPRRVADLSEEELTRELDLEPEELEEVLRTSRQTWVDSPLEDEEQVRPLRLLRSQTLLGAEDLLIQKSFRQEIEEILKRLQPRERRVIELRYGLGPEGPLTLEQIGKRLRLSRERIRQIEEGAKKRLRIFAKSRRLQDYLN
ncbi:MAG: RNA polymerase sigma factor RpoD/SigA [candidate division NC10 bacterium]|nr:RNA polymerase sigma factor RpoD/SigA [candidate division NC10 bacterium]